MKNVITIDGPSGSGKSTVSRLVAEKLGYGYLDTGALYRAVAWKVKEEKADIENVESLGKILKKIDITFDKKRIMVNGTDVTSRIRDPDIGELSSRVSAKPAVRKHLFTVQRQIGLKGNVVIEGRDTGTVIFPESENKFFLDASIEERSRRRYEELKKSGSVELDSIIEGIKTRDKRDSTREHSPLKKTADMIYIDTCHLSVEEVVKNIIGALKKS